MQTMLGLGDKISLGNSKKSIYYTSLTFASFLIPTFLIILSCDNLKKWSNMKQIFQLKWRNNYSLFKGGEAQIFGSFLGPNDQFLN